MTSSDQLQENLHSNSFQKNVDLVSQQVLDETPDKKNFFRSLIQSRRLKLAMVVMQLLASQQGMAKAFENTGSSDSKNTVSSVEMNEDIADKNTVNYSDYIGESNQNMSVDGIENVVSSNFTVVTSVPNGTAYSNFGSAPMSGIDREGYSDGMMNFLHQDWKKSGYKKLREKYVGVSAVDNLGKKILSNDYTTVKMNQFAAFDVGYMKKDGSLGVVGKVLNYQGKDVDVAIFKDFTQTIDGYTCYLGIIEECGNFCWVPVQEEVETKTVTKIETKYTTTTKDNDEGPCEGGDCEVKLKKGCPIELAIFELEGCDGELDITTAGITLRNEQNEIAFKGKVDKTGKVTEVDVDMYDGATKGNKLTLPEGTYSGTVILYDKNGKPLGQEAIKDLEAKKNNAKGKSVLEIGNEKVQKVVADVTNSYGEEVLVKLRNPSTGHETLPMRLEDGKTQSVLLNNVTEGNGYIVEYYRLVSKNSNVCLPQNRLNAPKIGQENYINPNFNCEIKIEKECTTCKPYIDLGVGYGALNQVNSTVENTPQQSSYLSYHYDLNNQNLTLQDNSHLQQLGISVNQDAGSGDVTLTYADGSKKTFTRDELIADADPQTGQGQKTFITQEAKTVETKDINKISIVPIEANYMGRFGKVDFGGGLKLDLLGVQQTKTLSVNGQELPVYDTTFNTQALGVDLKARYNFNQNFSVALTPYAMYQMSGTNSLPNLYTGARLDLEGGGQNIRLRAGVDYNTLTNAFVVQFGANFFLFTR